MRNWSHSINGKSDGGVLDVNYDGKKRNYTATTCDADLKNVQFKELDFLDNKTYLFPFFSAGRLYLFATDKNKSLLKYEVNPQTFALIGSPENIFSFDDGIIECRSVYSKDSSYFSIFCRNHNKKTADDLFSVIVFNSAFSIVNKYEFSPLVPSNEVAAIYFILSESGTSAIICKGAKQKKKNDDEIYYSATVTSLNEKPISKLISGFPSGSIQNLYWYFSKNDILFQGLLGDSQKSGFTKVAGGHYNIHTGAVEEMKVSAFDGSEINFKSSSYSVKQIKDHGIPFNVSLKYAIDADNNSIFLIYDQDQHHQTQAYHEPGRYAPIFTEFTSAETYVIKLNREKKPEWFHVISKKQIETEGQMYTGINYILGKDNTLYIFFHDNNDNLEVYADGNIRETGMLNIKKNSLACITIKPAGDISKSFLWDNADMESYMMPNNSILNKRDEVTFLAVKKSKDGWFTLSKMTIGK